ncbi:MAG TPA: TraB/GumN family protein [Allosphingosinicella sp.]|jgi:hypothetical protein
MAAVRIGAGLLALLAGVGLAAAPLAAGPAKPPAPVERPAAPAAPAAPQAPAAEPRPAIWLLEDADTRIYLFGTTHIFERGFRWRSPRLDRVIREADELVLETDDEEAVDETAIMRSMFMDKPVPILERVSPERREALRALIERSGLPMEMWDQLHSFAAGFMLIAVQMNEGLDEGDDPEARASGAEVELRAAFREMGRPVSAVESTEMQMGFFRSMSAEAQRGFLDMMVEASSVPYEESGLSGDAAWATGNLEQIENEFEGMPRELYDVLLTRRNRNWTEWLARRLERPGTVLFAVGVGHLVGPDSVQNMLAARGLTARRID